MVERPGPEHEVRIECERRDPVSVVLQSVEQASLPPNYYFDNLSAER